MGVHDMDEACGVANAGNMPSCLDLTLVQVSGSSGPAGVLVLVIEGYKALEVHMQGKLRFCTSFRKVGSPAVG